jgi:ABC-type lipoprotein export system ATPase subunit
VIEIEGLCRSYGSGATRHDVLRNLELTLHPAEMVAVIGRSGSGKTTLLSILGGLDPDFTGSVKVDGLQLRGLDDTTLSRYRSSTVGMVFQGNHHVAHISCLDNVCLPALFSRSPGLRWSTTRERARELLDLVGLASLERRRPGELSGGQKQRLGIARALLNRPSILLCDEVTGNLDTDTGDEILRLLSRLNRLHRVTVVMATHDTRAAAAARRLVRMQDGCLHQETPASAPGSVGP